jgi:hypothetical protein
MFPRCCRVGFDAISDEGAAGVADVVEQMLDLARSARVSRYREQRCDDCHSATNRMIVAAKQGRVGRT